MFGQMTAGSWIYIGTQGILQGTYQTFAAAGEKHFGSADLAGRTILTAGLGGMGGAQPLAATMAGAAILCVEVDPRSDRAAARDALPRRGGRLARRRARARARRGRARGGALGRRCSATPPTSFPELAARGEHFDLVTDQTAAHDPLTGYVPAEVPFEEAAALRARDPQRVPAARVASRSSRTCAAMLEFVRAGSYVFDYGNNLRGEAYEAGVRTPSHTRASSRPISGRSSAAGSGRSAGPRSRVTRRTSRRSTASCGRSSPTTRSCSAGSSWRPSGSRSRGCPRGSAGSATATARGRGSRSTSSCARARCRRRS